MSSPASTRRVYRASLASLVAGLGPATAVGNLSARTFLVPCELRPTWYLLSLYALCG
jgi:hypothetical protein